MITIRAKIQKGFSLVTAIFLLVVLGTLGTLMATFFAAQQQSSALDVMGSRAYQAARAGIEWAAFNVNATPAGTLWAGCAAYPGPVPGVILFTPAAVSLAGDLAPFTVMLTCVSTPVADGGTKIIYDFTSTASSGGVPGNPDYVERVLNVKLWN